MKQVSETIDWPGKSGQKYPMMLYELPCSMQFDGDGVYIMCRLAEGQWQAVFIGHGDLSERVRVTQKDRGIYHKGATHVCVGYAQGAKSGRQAIVDDLLAVHREAYEPTGCNERP